MNTVRLKNTLVENLYATVSVVGSLFFVLVLLIPSFTVLPSLQSQLSSKGDELVQLRAKSSTLNSLIINQSTLKTNSELVDTAIPSRDNVPTLMTQIQTIAVESGVSLKALQFGASSNAISGSSGSKLAVDKSVKKVVLQAVAEGPFTNVESFLQNLEKASRLISVESLTFETKNNGQIISATLTLISYYIDNVPASSAPSLDLASENLKVVLTKLKTLKVYETEVTFSGVGKANPFQ